MEMSFELSSWPRSRLQAEARRMAGWTTTALGFTIPIWVVADGILVVLLVVCWLASGEWRERMRRVLMNPVALSASLLFGWLLLGTLWGEGSSVERMLGLKKYADLLLIPVLVSMVITSEERHRAILAFATSLVLTLVLSLISGVGVLPFSGVSGCDMSNPCIFKRHITHNMLMAFGALLFGVLAWKSSRRWRRWAWGGASCLAAGNVLLMVQGRTGYVVLAGLIVLALHIALGWRGAVAAVAVVVFAFSAAYHVSNSFHTRASKAIATVLHWDPQTADVGIRERVEFYQNTVRLIEDHPIFGVGTGGYVQAYAVYAKQAGLPGAFHPHNQYMMIMAQVGIVGLCLLLWLFVQQWRLSSFGGDVIYEVLARGLIVVMVLGCLFNDLLLDHTEKLLYCWLSGLLYSGSEAPLGARA
jgi:O-antigen ligase